MATEERRTSASDDGNVIQTTKWDVPLLAIFGGADDIHEFANSILNAVKTEFQVRELSRENIHLRYVNDDAYIGWPSPLGAEASSVRLSYRIRMETMQLRTRSATGTEELEQAQLVSRLSQGTLVSILSSVDEQVQRAESEDRKTIAVANEQVPEGRRNRELDGQDAPPAVRRTTAIDMSLPTLSQNMELAYLDCVEKLDFDECLELGKIPSDWDHHPNHQYPPPPQHLNLLWLAQINPSGTKVLPSSVKEEDTVCKTVNIDSMHGIGPMLTFLRMMKDFTPTNPRSGRRSLSEGIFPNSRHSSKSNFSTQSKYANSIFWERVGSDMSIAVVLRTAGGASWPSNSLLRLPSGTCSFATAMVFLSSDSARWTCSSTVVPV